MMIILTLFAVYAQALGRVMRKRSEARDRIVWNACLYPGRTMP